jgi:hypothetical protein
MIIVSSTEARFKIGTGTLTAAEVASKVFPV